MGKGRIVILTGAPGTGKTTVADRLAEISEASRTVHMHTDDFYHYLRKGGLSPEQPGAEEQNRVVIDAILAAAKCYAAGGYETIVDGIIGPWFLEPWQRVAGEYEIHYVILWASRKETMARAIGRAKLDRETNGRLVETMWGQFSGLEAYETYVVDTTDRTVEEVVAAVKERIRRKEHLLPGTGE